MYNLNRKAIREALNDYLELNSIYRQAKDNAINDDEIQSLLDNRQTRQYARELINERYPEATSIYNRKVTSAAITLIEAMTDNIEEYSNIDPLDIYMNYTTFNKLLNLAKQV